MGNNLIHPDEVVHFDGHFVTRQQTWLRPLFSNFSLGPNHELIWQGGIRTQIEQNDFDGVKRTLQNLPQATSEAVLSACRTIFPFCSSLEMVELLYNHFKEIKDTTVFYLPSFRPPLPLLVAYMGKHRIPAVEIFTAELDPCPMLKPYIEELKGDVNAVIPCYDRPLLYELSVRENFTAGSVEYLLDNGADPTLKVHGRDIFERMSLKLENARFTTEFRRWEWRGRKFILNMNKELERIRQRLDELYYAPGMPGMVKAKEEFEQEASTWHRRPGYDC